MALVKQSTSCITSSIIKKYDISCFIRKIYNCYCDIKEIVNAINLILKKYENEKQVLDFICKYIWDLKEHDGEQNLAIILATHMNFVFNEEYYLLLKKVIEHSNLSLLFSDNLSNKSCLLDMLLVNKNPMFYDLILYTLKFTPINLISVYNIAVFIKNQIINDQEYGISNIITLLNYIFKYNSNKTIFDFKKDEWCEEAKYNNIISHFLNIISLECINIFDVNVTDLFQDVLQLLLSYIQDEDKIYDIMNNTIGDNIMTFLFPEEFHPLYKNKLNEIENINMFNIFNILDRFKFDFIKFNVLSKYLKIATSLKDCDNIVIQFLKEKYKFKIYQTEECGICLNLFSNVEIKELVIVDCGHTICNNCSAKIEKKCPFCRKEIHTILDISLLEKVI